MNFADICEFFPNTEPLRCTGGKVPNAFKTFFSKSEISKICISLSGGVDSMVSSWILKQLLPKTEILALHINYNNRETSDHEEKFIKWWCNMIDIECKIVNMELKREDYMKHGRNYYERETHRLRFDAYYIENCPIVLGHNYDDCVENIISAQ